MVLGGAGWAALSPALHAKNANATHVACRAILIFTSPALAASQSTEDPYPHRQVQDRANLKMLRNFSSVVLKRQERLIRLILPGSYAQLSSSGSGAAPLGAMLAKA
jgi:hypothetical protein